MRPLRPAVAAKGTLAVWRSARPAEGARIRYRLRGPASALEAVSLPCSLSAYQSSPWTQVSGAYRNHFADPIGQVTSRPFWHFWHPDLVFYAGPWTQGDEAKLRLPR